LSAEIGPPFELALAVNVTSAPATEATINIAALAIIETNSRILSILLKGEHPLIQHPLSM
jgi:hypothetical protein